MSNVEDNRISKGNFPDFDINLAEGSQAQLWVIDICDTMKKNNGEIEVKAPKPFLKYGSPYVEYACRHADGEWHASGINTTKAKLWAFTFGSLPGMLVVETAWLKRAAKRAYQRGHLREETDGSNPTKGVCVTFEDLMATREHDP